MHLADHLFLQRNQWFLRQIERHHQQSLLSAAGYRKCFYHQHQLAEQKYFCHHFLLLQQNLDLNLYLKIYIRFLPVKMKWSDINDIAIGKKLHVDPKINQHDYKRSKRC